MLRWVVRMLVDVSFWPVERDYFMECPWAGKREVFSLPYAVPGRTIPREHYSPLSNHGHK
jgi:hypothetical protein